MNQNNQVNDPDVNPGHQDDDQNEILLRNSPEGTPVYETLKPQNIETEANVEINQTVKAPSPQAATENNETANSQQVTTPAAVQNVVDMQTGSKEPTVLHVNDPDTSFANDEEDEFIRKVEEAHGHPKP